MSVVIASLVVLGILFIATENVNRMNRSAVAMFIGVLCWLLYIIDGSHLLTAEHADSLAAFLDGRDESRSLVKDFIADSLFLKYMARAAEVALFLFGTMTTLDVLTGNGCFDFLPEWLRTRNPRRYLWWLAGFTFVLSANLDNLITVCMMLAVMHTMVSDRRLRMTYGAVIVLAANCGGAFTVIGDVSSLTLWMEGLVTPTRYAAMQVLSAVVALVVVLLLVMRELPRRLDVVQTAPPYRGDDTILTRWQRLLMLFVGIGGLWFVPTFHRLTHLPPFVGVLCVLSFLWIVDELCNRSLLGSDRMVRKRQPQALQYANMQHILFYVGLTFAFGALAETGLLTRLLGYTATYADNLYGHGLCLGLLSALGGNLSVVLGGVALFADASLPASAELSCCFRQDGVFWPLLSYTTALGGTLLPIGTLAGCALMRMEDVSIKWYLRHFAPKVLLAWLTGLALFFLLAS